MVWAEKCILLVQLVSWALLLGSAVSQLRLPEVTKLMLVGAFGQFIAGVALMVIAEVQPDPVNHAKIIVILVMMLVIAVLSALNRRFESIPTGLLGMLVLLTVAVMGLNVLWGNPLQLV